MIRFLSILTVLITILSSGCISFDHNRFDYDLTEKNSGETLYPEIGDEIRICLKTNPSTGYFWGEESRPDSDVIRMFDQTIKTDKAPAKTGVPGTHEFLYKVVGSGETGIRLFYRRPWENKRPEETFQLRIIVKQEKEFLDFLNDRDIPKRRVGSKGQIEPELE